MMIKKQPQNIAGMMGQISSQPAQGVKAATIDPLERLQQRMVGRTQGGAIEGVKKKKSMLNSFRMV
jgi:hypothetical protein|tara:strand:- start:201 stop:398 length:198 start_codon:yes stop_codon:yes gene_type:complete